MRLVKSDYIPKEYLKEIVKNDYVPKEYSKGLTKSCYEFKECSFVLCSISLLTKNQWIN